METIMFHVRVAHPHRVILLIIAYFELLKN